LKGFFTQIKFICVKQAHISEKYFEYEINSKKSF